MIQTFCSCGWARKLWART